MFILFLLSILSSFEYFYFFAKYIHCIIFYVELIKLPKIGIFYFAKKKVDFYFEVEKK